MRATVLGLLALVAKTTNRDANKSATEPNDLALVSRSNHVLISDFWTSVHAERSGPNVRLTKHPLVGYSGKIKTERES
jgi:hypothetical protein